MTPLEQYIKTTKNDACANTSQCVKCHPIFMNKNVVTIEYFDNFVETLKRNRIPERSVDDIRTIYFTLLKSGFFDSYHGVYFDPSCVTTYTSIMASFKYNFDMKISKLNTIDEKRELITTTMKRVDNFKIFRSLGCNISELRTIYSDVENERYHCLNSVIVEIIHHLNRSYNFMG